MKNQYTGDVGDFGKFGMLRCIATAGPTQPLRLGVNWYLTPDEPHNDDGQFLGYLDVSKRQNISRFRICDAALYDGLRSIIASGVRNVREVEQRGLLPEGTVFYSDPLYYDPKSNRGGRLTQRLNWVCRGLDRLSESDVVFFDPDNGLEVPSYSRISLAGPKYVFFDDLAAYYRRGQSLIIYNHRNRKPEDEYLGRFRLLREVLPGAQALFFLRFKRYSVRDYILVPQTQHRDLLLTRIVTMLQGPWGQHFELHSV